MKPTPAMIGAAHDVTHEQIAADPYLEDAIAHPEWRGIAKAVMEDGRVTVIFEEQRRCL